MGALQQAFDVRLGELVAAATVLEEQVRGLAEAYAGLKDMDLSLRLAAARLDVCLHVLGRLVDRSDLRETASTHALGAAAILDGLAAENVSEDQRDALRKGPAWDSVRERLERFLEAGGAALLAHPGMKALHDAGVTIIPGTDALAGYTLHHELELYVRAGIGPAEVLRMATLTPALVMGVNKDRGVIAAGKLADMILVDGDPTKNICDIHNIMTVIKGGKVYDPTAIEKALGITSREARP